VQPVDLVCRTATLHGIPVLQLSGEIDLSTAPALHRAVRRLVDDHRGRLVAVDLDGTHAIDDAGLGILLGSAGRAREAGGDLVIVSTSERLRQRFATTRLDRAVDVRDAIGG
jgi:anti-anti-sigma factor